MPIFTPKEEQRIVAEIREAEHHTTGEIRVFVEAYSFHDLPVTRAAEVFALHKMAETKDRNGVLIYIAERSRQYAIWGDVGIHQLESQSFWHQEKAELKAHFREGRFAEGVIKVIHEVGRVLAHHYPSDGHTNNELSDEIIYG
jgi:uncharacterized membrane protein